MEESLAALGLRLAQLRTRRGLSQVQVARAAGVSHDTIGALERGERLLDDATLGRIGEALGIGVLGVSVLAEHLQMRRRNREKAVRLIARNPGIATMLSGLDEGAHYSQAALALLAGAVVAMEQCMAAAGCGQAASAGEP